MFYMYIVTAPANDSFSPTVEFFPRETKEQLIEVLKAVDFDDIVSVNITYHAQPYGNDRL